MTQHEKISVELRKRLDAMHPGERFPSEPELCREFGVARMTVNKVVTELVRDGRLVRQRGRGSFVAEAPRERSVINSLLPCAAYPADPRAPFLRTIAFGISEEARNQDTRMDLIPVSPENSQEPIDFSMLERLNEKSLVAIPAEWFYAVFPFPAKRKCKALPIDRQMRSRYPNREYAEQFKIQDYDLPDAVDQAVRRLYHKGCRRIALRTAYREDHPVQYVVYSETVHRLGLPDLALFRREGSYKISAEEHAELQQIACDALIFDAFECGGLSEPDFTAIFGIPAGLTYEGIRFCPEDNDLVENPPTSNIDAPQPGIEAVRMLLDPDAPFARNHEFAFFQRKQTKIVRQQSVLIEKYIKRRGNHEVFRLRKNRKDPEDKFYIDRASYRYRNHRGSRRVAASHAE